MRLVAALAASVLLAGFAPQEVAAVQDDPALDVVADFAEIQVGEVRVIPDPSGASATLEVITSIDAVCAVVYGDDEAFGQLATDLDMAGAGHRDHRVVLAGLRPETTYVYRLQGSGPDGRLYRSRVFTFRTPAMAPSDSPNLAVGARVFDVSSEFSAAFAAANAVDGDPTTEWSSRGDGDDAYVSIDLGRPVDVTAIAFRTRQMSDGTAMTETFTVTADGQELGPFPAGLEPIPVNVSAQMLRFDVTTSTGGNTGAVEIEVHGTDASAP